LNKIKKELFETFEDLKDVTINGETFKARGKMVFLTVDNKELEKAVEEKGLIPYLIAEDVKETVEEPKTEEKPKPKKVVKNASTGKNK
jgi:hypothetical protein